MERRRRDIESTMDGLIQEGLIQEYKIETRKRHAVIDFRIGQTWEHMPYPGSTRNVRTDFTRQNIKRIIRAKNGHQEP